MDALLFRLVPPQRMRAGVAVLATGTGVVTSTDVVAGERRVWELVHPGSGLEDFAAAIAVTMHDDQAREVRILEVVVADPDVLRAATLLVRALVAEVQRDGAVSVTIVPPASEETRAMLDACGFVAAGGRGTVTPTAAVWRYAPA